MSPLPFATGDLEGVAFEFKVHPADFQVDERPLYLPSGEGEHLFLLVKKEGRDTLHVAREIARALGAPPKQVGIAGQKDRHALTTQWLSLQGPTPEEALALRGEGFEILEAKRHGNKLRTGHLKGNRFRIVLRGLAPGATAQVRRIAEALNERGLPNYYGPQRFGRSGDNAEVGRRILVGDEGGGIPRDGKLRRLLVSAFQSELFNRVLASRLEAGNWDTPLEGDVLMKLESGGLFVSEEPEVDGPRVRSFECSVTGPLPGPKMRPAPTGRPAAIEAEVLEQAGVPKERFAQSRLTPGARRALRIPVAIEVEEGEADTCVLSFELPAGAYATSVLREMSKEG